MSIGDVRRFLALMSEWRKELDELGEVILERGHPQFDASYRFFDCTIKLQPWATLSPTWWSGHVWGHDSILTRLNVPLEAVGDSFVCRFTRDTARAYMLLHVFMHEIGHHLYFVRNGMTSDRSEKYAEEFALRFEGLMWAAIRGQVWRSRRARRNRLTARSVSAPRPPPPRSAADPGAPLAAPPRATPRPAVTRRARPRSRRTKRAHIPSSCDCG